MPAISADHFKKLEPYIQLGEKLGAFLGQLAGDRIQKVQISYDGGLATLNTTMVRNAVLKGVLTPALSHRVNLINASALAQKRGIEVGELRSARRATFSNSLGIGIFTEGGSATGVGFVGLRGTLRILGLNDIDIEAPLRGVIIVIRNQDVPGVIGRVGTILGNHNINIATFTLGRDSQSKQAMALVNVDGKVSEAVLAEIRTIPAVSDARVVEV
jgi:D-3-phosphoglycerate dehydrogenase